MVADSSIWWILTAMGYPLLLALMCHPCFKTNYLRVGMNVPSTMSSTVFIWVTERQAQGWQHIRTSFNYVCSMNVKGTTGLSQKSERLDFRTMNHATVKHDFVRKPGQTGKSHGPDWSTLKIRPKPESPCLEGSVEAISSSGRCPVVLLKVMKWTREMVGQWASSRTNFYTSLGYDKRGSYWLTRGHLVVLAHPIRVELDLSLVDQSSR